MKLAIVGSRTFNDYTCLKRAMSRIHAPVTEIISGGARGADALAARYAHERNIPLREILADWTRWGKSAGFRRNADIIQAADNVLAFWDGLSKGTAHDLQLAKTYNKPCHIVYF